MRWLQSKGHPELSPRLWTPLTVHRKGNASFSFFTASFLHLDCSDPLPGSSPRPPRGKLASCNFKHGKVTHVAFPSSLACLTGSQDTSLAKSDLLGPPSAPQNCPQGPGVRANCSQGGSSFSPKPSSSLSEWQEGAHLVFRQRQLKCTNTVKMQGGNTTVEPPGALRNESRPEGRGRSTRKRRESPSSDWSPGGVVKSPHNQKISTVLQDHAEYGVPRKHSLLPVKGYKVSSSREAGKSLWGRKGLTLSARVRRPHLHPLANLSHRATLTQGTADHKTAVQNSTVVQQFCFWVYAPKS